MEGAHPASLLLSQYPLMGRSALRRKTKTRQQQQNKPRVGKPSIQFSVIFYIRGHWPEKFGEMWLLMAVLEPLSGHFQKTNVIFTVAVLISASNYFF